jgi:hypothetical protein
MKLLLPASMLLLAAAFVLGSVPGATASPSIPKVTCASVFGPEWTGVWVETPAGPVGMCCDLNEDPSPCYVEPQHPLG